jgi:hypothetical protein
MTAHDLTRKRRAESCNRDDIEMLHDAIVGLQSTDDPELCPLYYELCKRLRELEEKSATETNKG